MKTQKGSVAIIILVILLIAGGGYYYISQKDVIKDYPVPTINVSQNEQGEKNETKTIPPVPIRTNTNKNVPKVTAESVGKVVEGIGTKDDCLDLVGEDKDGLLFCENVFVHGIDIEEASRIKYDTGSNPVQYAYISLAINNIRSEIIINGDTNGSYLGSCTSLEEKIVKEYNSKKQGDIYGLDDFKCVDSIEKFAFSVNLEKNDGTRDTLCVDSGGISDWGVINNNLLSCNKFQY